MVEYYSVSWENGVVRMLDQRLLPQELKYLDYTDYQQVAHAIQEMVIRGAPAIGAAVAYGLALCAFHSQVKEPDDLREELNRAGMILKSARPTAVNLAWAVDRVLMRVAEANTVGVVELRLIPLQEAKSIVKEGIYTEQQIGLNALPLIPEKATFIHHCNTGALATIGQGTALGVIRTAHEHGRQVFVYVDETRPRLQGAHLTTWELKQLGIPHAVIVDGASGFVMKYKHVDLVTVGCDRIAANGDTANKIGTYNLAIVAKAHGVPFYIVGPTSTIDLCTPNGDAIEIEERPSNEVTHIGTEQITPEDTQVFNPAFDITPARYISGIITEAGIAYPPYEKSLVEQVAKMQAYWQAQKASQ